MSLSTGNFGIREGARASLRVLDGSPADAGSATILRLSGKRLTVECGAVRPGVAVRVDVDGALLLGEVIAFQDGTATLAIEQVIPSVPELAKLMQSIFATGPQSVSPARERTASMFAGRH